jgi:hypothetical protein
LSNLDMKESSILKRYIIYETFARAGFLFCDKAKVFEMRNFTLVNNRLSKIPMLAESKKTTVEGFSYV